MKENKDTFTKPKTDQLISIALMASYILLTIQYFILIYFNLLGTSIGGTIQAISKIFVGLTYIIALPGVIKRIKFKILYFYFIAIFIFLFQYLIFPNNRVYLFEVSSVFFVVCLPAFIYSQSIYDLRVFIDIMKKASIIVFAFAGLLSVMIFTGKAVVGFYSMTLSYYLLLPTIVFIDDYFDNKKLTSIFISVISFVFILTLGSRGPILCLIGYSAVKFFIFNRKITFKSILIYISGFVTGLLLFINWEQLILFLYNLFKKYGIESRTLLLFMRTKLHMSGREDIYNVLIGKILDRPIIGHGIRGDVVILDGKGFSHNFIIEIFINYGLIMGPILISLILFLLIKGLSSKNTYMLKLVLIWFSIGFVHLMVSSSYLIDFKFWTFLGILLNKAISPKLTKTV